MGSEMCIRDRYEIINDEDFIEGNVDTGFIERFQKKHQSENEAE